MAFRRTKAFSRKTLSSAKFDKYLITKYFLISEKNPKSGWKENRYFFMKHMKFYSRFASFTDLEKLKFFLQKIYLFLQSTQNLYVLTSFDVCAMTFLTHSAQLTLSFWISLTSRLFNSIFSVFSLGFQPIRLW